MARNWVHVVDQSIYISDDGSWLEYGDFGRDTYGLHTEIDGKQAIIRLFGSISGDVPEGYDLVAEADKLLDRIASGWRAVNW